jgi:hypothetical protein
MKMGLDGLSDVSPVVLVARVVGGGVETWWGRRLVPYTDESALFCSDSSINNEAKCERAAGVPTWFGFPHHGNNGSMVVGILVLW